ncbi:MAG: CBS domain-containing protein [Deltaproteobacteria bacterium]|jgi:CBS domain-containing protein|nr:CBS domain-containing protein [Deltaproteobacteria bacterium]MBW2507667.1 CBS domain-containing protein [Deltaproteobacteria bacterium]
MQCPSCDHDNLPGADQCEVCGTDLMQEDVPVTRIRSAIEKSLCEDRIEILNPAEAVSVPEDTPLDVAIEAMREKKIGCVLVTDSDGRLRGIFTERDLLHKVAGKVEDLAAHSVSQYMTRNPEVVREDQLLASALQRMMVGDLRHLPIVDEQSRPRKIMSSRDAIGYWATLVKGILEPNSSSP